MSEIKFNFIDRDEYAIVELEFSEPLTPEKLKNM